MGVALVPPATPTSSRLHFGCSRFDGCTFTSENTATVVAMAPSVECSRCCRACIVVETGSRNVVWLGWAAVEANGARIMCRSTKLQRTRKRHCHSYSPHTALYLVLSSAGGGGSRRPQEAHTSASRTTPLSTVSRRWWAKRSECREATPTSPESWVSSSCLSRGRSLGVTGACTDVAADCVEYRQQGVRLAGSATHLHRCETEGEVWPGSQAWLILLVAGQG